MNPSILGAAAAAVAVPLAFALFRWLVPVRETLIDPAALPELVKRYAKWDVVGVLLCLPCAAALTGVWYLALSALARRVLPEAADAVLVIVPDQALWLVIALFLGIVSSAGPLELLWRRLLGDRYPEYMAVQRAKHGFDGMKVFAALAVLVGIGCAGLLALGLDHYACFTEDAIVINDLLGFGERTYPYEGVRAVQAVESFRAPLGNIIDRPHFAIELADGTRWTTLSGALSPAPGDAARLAELVAVRAGLPIERVAIGE